MPYAWKTVAKDIDELTLWPHRSLSPRGFAVVILSIFTLSIVPLFGLLGTVLLWGILPFLLLALAGTWAALRRNDHDRRILETLRLDPEQMHLTRANPRGDRQEWQCNRYWAKVRMHEKGGPVPHYVTLSGAGREVEIGAFLSEEERKTLYAELCRKVRDIAQP